MEAAGHWLEGPGHKVAVSGNPGASGAIAGSLAGRGSSGVGGYGPSVSKPSVSLLVDGASS